MLCRKRGDEAIGGGRRGVAEGTNFGAMIMRIVGGALVSIVP